MYIEFMCAYHMFYLKSTLNVKCLRIFVLFYIFYIKNCIFVLVPDPNRIKCTFLTMYLLMFRFSALFAFLNYFFCKKCIKYIHVILYIHFSLFNAVTGTFFVVKVGYVQNQVEKGTRNIWVENHNEKYVFRDFSECKILYYFQNLDL